MKPTKLFLALAVAVLLGACTSANNCYIIEGKLSGIKEGTEIHLFSNEEMIILSPIATTQLKNGKFRFEIEALPDTTLLVQLVVDANYGSLPRLWVSQGTRTTIKGKGWNYCDWKIRGGAPEQETENKIVAATRGLRSEGNVENNDFYTSGLEGLTGERYETRIRMFQRGLAFGIENVPLRGAICDALAELPIDQAWIVNLYEAARSLDEEVKSKGQALYARLSDEQKSSEYGKTLEWYLFPVPTVEIGEPLFDGTLYDLNDERHHLINFRGKYVLLDFWFAGCKPCIQAIPELKQIEESYNGDLVVVSISSDKVEVWKEASERLGITGNNFNDHKEKLGIVNHYVGCYDGYPRFYLAAPNGTVIDYKQGYRSGELTEFVEKAIKEYTSNNK